jgi:hypothetical protein
MGRERVVQWLVLGCAAAWTLSCSRRDAAPAGDTALDTTHSTSGSPGRSADWASELGQLLVVPSDSDNSAVVLYPDDPTAQLIASQPMTLVNAAGDTTRVRLVASDSQECGDAPVVRLAGAAPAAWSVGMLARSARLLRMDSIEALPSADSARLAADLARLASGLRTQQGSRFTGLPFAVLGAHRFQSDGREFLVAHLVRRLNQEAAPLEERTLLIAERPAPSPASEPYVVTYSQRSEGSEDTAEHFELLAAVRGNASPLLLLARDQLSKTSYEILEHVPDDGWRTRWSRTLSC